MIRFFTFWVLVYVAIGIGCWITFYVPQEQVEATIIVYSILAGFILSAFLWVTDSGHAA